MQQISEFGRLLVGGGLLSMLACAMYLLPDVRKRNSTDDPMYSPEELRKLDIEN